MGKTEREIIAAHKNSIEAYTGKECSITLIDKIDSALKSTSLETLLKIVERQNTTGITIKTASVNREVTKFRKLFCLFACKKVAASQVGKFINQDHSSILYSVKTGKELLKKDATFRYMYHIIRDDIIFQSKG